MLYDLLREWRSYESRDEARHALLIFHTSCVNYDLEDLTRTLEFSFRWMIPDNVYWELRLLQSSRFFGERASFLLRHARRNPTWDLEQFYENCRQPVSGGQVDKGVLLFLFGDLSKQEEFIRRARDEREIYVLLRGEWGCAREHMERDRKARVLTLSSAKKFHVCRPKPLETANVKEQIQSMPSIRTNAPGLSRLPGSALKPTRMSGAYAQIYQCDAFPGQMIKCYKKFAAINNYHTKLQYLEIFGTHQNISAMPLALPQTLLYYGEDCIGYVMRKRKGEAARKFILTNWNAYEHIVMTAFRELLLLLLELHCFHMLVNDLSSNNVLIDPHGHVSIVDCDSFQILEFPGGKITESYRHPNIDAERCGEELREPRYEDFALAVLLFQCVFGQMNPLTQVQTAKNGPPLDWEHVKFPLDTQGAYRTADGKRLEPNEETLKMWMELPEGLRKTFADEFHFRGDNSIGAWIRGFGVPVAPEPS